MKVMRWRCSRVIKALLLAVVIFVVVYVVSLVLITVDESRCSNDESRKIIRDLCNKYRSHKVEGTFCHDICNTKALTFQKCVNYKRGKKVFISECNGVCLEGKKVKAVIKTRNMEGHHFEPLHLQPETGLPLSKDTVLKGAMALGNQMKPFIGETDFTEISSMDKIFSKLWGISLSDFVKNNKYPGADNVALESLWSLIAQEEYLLMAAHQESHFIPQIYGTCGQFYVTEYAPSGKNLPSSPSLLINRQGPWRERVDIALQMLDIIQALDFDFHEPLHFCDVKEENFGISSKGQVKILDTDALFFETSMMKDLGDPKCTQHSNCDFFDCRGWCDLEKGQCVPKRTNNNLQNLCEDIFVDRAFNFYQGLLCNPPKVVASELKQLLEECAYPNANKGEIVRTKTPKAIFWKLVNLLKKSKRYS